MNNDVSVIIVTYNHGRYVRKCISTVLSNRPFEVIVVDNDSTDDTCEFVEEFDEVRLIHNENRGYGHGVNLGVKNCTGNIVFILNPDTYVETIDFNKISQYFVREGKKQVIIPKILKFDGNVNTIGLSNHFTGFSFTNTDDHSIRGASGAGFLMRRSEYLELGGFDESIFLYMEDSELSWNMISNDYHFDYWSDLVIYHDYSYGMTVRKYHNVEKGRMYIINKYYSNNDMLRLLPSLVLANMISFAFGLLNGGRYLHGYFNSHRSHGLFTCPKSSEKEGLYLKLDKSILPQKDLVDTAPTRVVNWIFSMNIRFCKSNMD